MKAQPRIESIYDAKLSEVRQVMVDLEHEAENVGADSPLGVLLATAHRLIDNLLDEYLAPSQ